MQPDKRLSELELKAMMHDPECGLVVDGVWGKTELLFPFAVYEAKKRAGNYQQAENQIYHACKTYLAMLDDLARNPNNVSEYQTKDSDKYQMFAFASCGSYWQVFIAWKLLDSCTVETIWDGDVKEFSRAFELICIVDQIQDYAVNHHRPFVMNHLEAWHARHQKNQEPMKNMVHEFETRIASMNVDISDGDSDISDSDFDVLAEPFYLSPNKSPEWLRLKELSKKIKKEMANQTRKRNQTLMKDLQLPKESGEEPVNKRPRGRPPKNEIVKKETPKRGRGRPKRRKQSAV